MWDTLHTINKVSQYGIKRDCENLADTRFLTFDSDGDQVICFPDLGAAADCAGADDGSADSAER